MEGVSAFDPALDTATARVVALVLYTGLAGAIAAVDAATRRIPDALVWPLLVGGLVANAFDLFVPATDAVVGAAAAAGLLAAVGRIVTWRLGRPALGFGDVKLAAALGAWVGWSGLPLLLLVAGASGTVVVLAGRAAGRLDMGAAVPFGPFLVAGGGLALLLGGG